MKIKETISKPRTLLTQEIRRLDITEVTAGEREKLYDVLLRLGFNKRNCGYEVHVNNTLCSFNSRKEAWHFRSGFQLAMELGGIQLPSYPDPDYSL